jgi:hypothetical protein
MDTAKLDFITKEYIPLLKGLQTATPGNWGKMNAQQMVEHVSAFFLVSAGKIKFNLVTPVEHLPKYREFLLSDKQFRENTKAPVNVIGEEAVPLRYGSMDEALQKLEEAIRSFEDYFKEDPNKLSMHPVFGELNFEDWVLLHYKHVTHHGRQFGLL